MSRELLVGVDIGGTKTAILVCDPSDGDAVGRPAGPWAPTARRASERAADSIASLVAAALAQASARPTTSPPRHRRPGRVDRDTGHVTLAVNSTGRPAARASPERGRHPDHCRKTTSERRRWASTSVACSIGAVARRPRDRHRHLRRRRPRWRLHRGALGLAGEIGHVIIDPTGSRCACGNRGCFETVAAGPAIVRKTLAGWAARRNGNAASDRERPLPGAEAVFASASGGDEVARDVVESAGRAVAWGIHLLALAYDVERIVLGGGVSHAGEPSWRRSSRSSTGTARPRRSRRRSCGRTSCSSCRPARTRASGVQCDRARVAGADPGAGPWQP